MGFFSNIMGKAESPMEADARAHATATDALFKYKTEALGMAREAALREGRAATMADYFIAAEMSAKGMQWGPKVIADLSGQTIDGFQINKADMEPPADLQAFALQQAATLAQSQGRAVTNLDMLQAMQQIKQSGTAIPPMATTASELQKLQGVDGLKDMMDLDGDHCVNKFFADVDRHAKFEKTVFSNVNFHPAGTLMRDGENGVALTEGASFNNVTFDGMSAQDTVNLAKGDYKNIKFENIKGGHIELAESSKIDGMDIRGQQAHLVLHEGASIDHMKVDASTRILSLNMDKNSVIANSNLGQSTIAMTSHFEAGATFQNVQLAGNLQGLDLSGVKLNNVTINGTPIQTATDLAQFDIKHEGTFAAVSAEFMRNHQVAELGKNLQLAMNGAGTNPPAAEVAALAAPAPTQLTATSQTDPLAAIRATLQAAQQSIGQLLNEQETANLAAIREANQARAEASREFSMAARTRNA